MWYGTTLSKALVVGLRHRYHKCIAGFESHDSPYPTAFRFVFCVVCHLFFGLFAVVVAVRLTRLSLSRVFDIVSGPPGQGPGRGGLRRSGRVRLSDDGGMYVPAAWFLSSLASGLFLTAFFFLVVFTCLHLRFIFLFICVVVKSVYFGTSYLVASSLPGVCCLLLARIVFAYRAGFSC